LTGMSAATAGPANTAASAKLWKKSFFMVSPVPWIRGTI
jgi:hypothetical protein